MSDPDAIRISIEVAVDPATAFAIFTEDVDAWWQRGQKYRNRAGPSVLRFEAGVGGCFVERHKDGSETQIGKVSVWEPGKLLVMSWHPSNFARDESTEVEISFEKTENGTRVAVVHRGLDHLRPDHPAKHGLEGRAFLMMRAGWWSELLGALKTSVDRRRAR